jgi:hypothetical protein
MRVLMNRDCGGMLSWKRELESQQMTLALRSSAFPDAGRDLVRSKSARLPLRLHCRDEFASELLYGRKPPEVEGLACRIGRDEEGRRLDGIFRNDSFAAAKIDPFEIDTHPHHHFVRESG